MRRDPYDELPAVPGFQLQSSLVGGGETIFRVIATLPLSCVAAGAAA
jgi:hypothetical protein